MAVDDGFFDLYRSTLLLPCKDAVPHTFWALSDVTFLWLFETYANQLQARYAIKMVLQDKESFFFHAVTLHAIRSAYIVIIIIIIIIINIIIIIIIIIIDL